MLQNAYLLANIGADTAENEPIFNKIWLVCRPSRWSNRPGVTGGPRHPDDAGAVVKPWPESGPGVRVSRSGSGSRRKDEEDFP